MTFGNNALRLTYSPSGSSSASTTNSNADANQSISQAGAEGKTEDGSIVISFNALDALEVVPTGEGWEEAVGGGVRVSMADKWGKQR